LGQASAGYVAYSRLEKRLRTAASEAAVAFFLRTTAAVHRLVVGVIPSVYASAQQLFTAALEREALGARKVISPVNCLSIV